jgi:hypothetical protein
MSDNLALIRELVAAGAAVFVAPPCPPNCTRPRHEGGRGTDGCGFDLPVGWQYTLPGSAASLATYREGHGIAMVGGHLYDFLDKDPQNDGDLGQTELSTAGSWPERVFGIVATPSGGRHFYLKSLGVRSFDAIATGIDLKAGTSEGGRGFVWLPGTVKRSKTTGELAPYTWIQEPDPSVAEWDELDDGSARLQERAVSRTKASAPKSADPFDANPERAGATEERSYTRTQAQEFLRPSLLALAGARKGQVEQLANIAACQLAHFVPEFWSAEQAYSKLHASASRALGGTWQDGITGWTLDKFMPVINGSRPLQDDWRARLVLEPTEPVAPEVAQESADDFEADVLDLDAILARPPAQPLIKGVLDLDSESWLIGKSGGFKSFFALDWACHVAAGKDWRGRKTVSGTVLYVAAEGDRGVGKRIKAWMEEHRVRPEKLVMYPKAIQVQDAKAWAGLVRYAEKTKPVLVVIDTQARVTAGLEENSAKDMGIFVYGVGQIKQATGACVLTVHHIGRAGTDARGSTAIDAAQDWEWKVERVGPVAEMKVRLTCDKSKDGDQTTHYTFRMKPVGIGHDEDFEPITSLVIGDELDEREERNAAVVTREIAAGAASLKNRGWVLGYMRLIMPTDEGLEEGMLTSVLKKRVPVLQRASGVSGQEVVTSDSVDRMMNELLSASLVERIGRGRYTLTEAGIQAAPNLRAMGVFDTSDNYAE